MIRGSDEDIAARSQESGLFRLEELRSIEGLQMSEFVPVGPEGMVGTMLIRVAGRWSIVFSAGLEAEGAVIYDQCMQTLRKP